MTVHVSLDLETWGTRPGCDIRSIGACVFDPVAGYVGGWDAANDGGFRDAIGDTFYIACDNPVGRMRNGEFVPELATGAEDYRKYPLHRDPQTVQWWSEQSDEAQAAFADPVDLRDALRRFDEWLTDVAPDQRIVLKRFVPNPLPREGGFTVENAISVAPLWSHGAATDTVWLAAAYEACGLPIPWHYRAPRDTRTAFDMAGIDDHSAWLKQHPGPMGVAHHALEDSISQARAVCAAYAKAGLASSNGSV